MNSVKGEYALVALHSSMVWGKGERKRERERERERMCFVSVEISVEGLTVGQNDRQTD